MYSILDACTNAYVKISKLEYTSEEIKRQINKLENTRISSWLQSLQQDETRLEKCINDVEAFHRDMFVLVSEEDVKDKISKNGANNPKYSVSEPESSPDEQESSLEQEQVPSSTMDYQLVTSESTDRVDILDNSVEGMYDLSVGMNVSVGVENGNYEPDVKIPESDIESRSNEVPDDDEVARYLLSKIKLDEEKEITKELLRLIFNFSRFQERLRIVEEKVASSGNYFPDRSNVPINRLMKSLCNSVLYLDKTVLKIYTKYSELLGKL